MKIYLCKEQYIQTLVDEDIILKLTVNMLTSIEYFVCKTIDHCYEPACVCCILSKAFHTYFDVILVYCVSSSVLRYTCLASQSTLPCYSQDTLLKQ